MCRVFISFSVKHIFIFLFVLDMKQRYIALSPAVDDKLSKIEFAVNDRKNFEAGKAKVEKWITETDEQIQEEPDLECPLPKLKEIHIFYQGLFYLRLAFLEVHKTREESICEVLVTTFA